ncbi:nucleotide exchange factor GrpE [Pelomicrobium methylotrophicum]|uniref:Protein GrpE n=1 Tax=Pelomicrobium methylotrophicum TaxID=2602750 RepID=A0A5C7EIT6_9PROT|nr:nucleotide exchange factor GrpE [Pelomicrobium methylotrophicum]TXF11328.1 nucleotide exchange factor GrpE [Pelomicrobium methylotrophicum]
MQEIEQDKAQTPAQSTEPPLSSATPSGAPVAEASAGQADTAAEGASQVDVIPSLEEMLRKAELAAQEHYDAWLRAKAEADNIRKRAEAEVASAHKYAVESFSTQLLPVKDSLETTLTVENASLEQLREGVTLTLKLLTQVFEKFGIREINPQGEKFDPHRHQAMTTVESDGPPGMVMQVMQKGYLLHDRVIRPALVVVSKAKSQA